jgi:hypothetical protein
MLSKSSSVRSWLAKHSIKKEH